jgi:hypothetical protein
MNLPTPVIRSHYGNGFRDQLPANNVNDYGIKKSVQNLPALRDRGVPLRCSGSKLAVDATDFLRSAFVLSRGENRFGSSLPTLDDRLRPIR